MKKLSMLKLIFIGFFVLSFSCTQAQQCACTIAGILPSAYNGKVYISRIEKSGKEISHVVVDSTSALNGKFEICLKKLQKIDVYQLYTKKMLYSAQVLLSPHTEMEVNIKDAENVEINVLKGGEEQKIMNVLSRCIKENNNRMFEISARNAKTSALKTEDGMIDSLNLVIAEEIKKYPTSFASFIALNDALFFDTKTYMDVYERLDTLAYNYSYYVGEAHAKYLKAKEKWLVDRNAEDFTAADLNGKLYTLSDFRGKYVLLDFWASWCKPCRKKMKEMASYIQKLNEKGIVVITFSFDNNKLMWENASIADKISWINLSDLKGFKKSPLIEKYKIEQLPGVFLISPTGKIIEQAITLNKLSEMELK